jgi:hypothetical protein
MLTLAHWAVAGLLEDAGLRAAFFTGRESQRQRTKNIVEFHDDPGTRILFASDAGGVGLNLQRAASCCVNLELPWNPAVLEQRVGRIYRLGQKKPIDVYNLISEGCIESRIASIVSDKRALFTGLFDGSSDEVRFDRSGSFLLGLARLIEPATVPDLPGAVEEGSSDAEAAVEREIEEIVSAADESQDPAPVPEAAEPSAPPQPPGVPAAAEVQRLFAGLEIRKKEDGGVVIDAAPEAADGLVALFTGMADLLRRRGSG